MGEFNKTTAAVIAGGLVTLVGAFVHIDPELQGAVQTLLVAGLVWVVPNIVKRTGG